MTIAERTPLSVKSRISRSPTFNSPLKLSYSRIKHFNNVVFPAPVCPTIPNVSPFLKLKYISFKFNRSFFLISKTNQQQIEYHHLL